LTSENRKKSLKYGWQLALISFTIGFTFFLAEITFYGWTMFIILPMIVGLSAGFLPSKKYGMYGVYIGLVTFFALLLLGRFEGLACLLYTMPVALLTIALGAFIAEIIKQSRKGGSNTLRLYLIPVSIFIASASIENHIGSTKEEDSVSTSVFLPYKADEVWDKIKSVDTLDTDKPLWLKIGLPVPQKCILEEEKLGAQRICIFEGGRIEEEITEIRKPEILKMKVTKYELTGRHWLHFKDAIYTFKEVTGGTIITRTTTYYSELKPRFYWRLCEHSAIKSEHEYVLNNLEKDLRVAKK
jgi:hypothetical protein